MKTQIHAKKLISLLLFAVMLIASLGTTLLASAAGADETAYKKSLSDKGFPDDYLDELYELHKKYPKWNFEVFDVTKASRDAGKDTAYTWDYVVYMETEENVKRSLVEKSQTKLRDYSDPTLYDTGWYKASEYAVEYMLDTRNFLDEKYIFQFLDLSFNESISVEAVQTACKGTFMENGKLDGEYSSMGYAEFFVKVGKETGLNPIYIAAVIRNEQGLNLTSLSNGKCGDKLWEFYSNGLTGTDSSGSLIAAPSSGYTEAQLKAYNGYYNFFNLGAAGTGKFTVYKNAMDEAKKGTEEMASEWGDGGAWNTQWKAIWGGAIKTADKYIGNKQNTFYLQKYNVNAASTKNFWGQYMQNIFGSYSRAASLYNAYKNNDLMDGDYTFQIPIYEGMPEEKCPYPTGSELQDTKYIDYYQCGDKIASYDTLSIKSYLGQDGVKSSYNSTINWPVFVGTKNLSLNLGRLNLSKYDYVLIEYSTAAKFDYKACGVRSIIGLVSDPNQTYGGEGEEQNLTADLGNESMKKKHTSGYEIRTTAKIDLSNVNYIGNVYLNAYTQPSQKYIVHNIVFVTLEGHTGTVEDTNPPPETTPAVTTSPDTTTPDSEISTAAPEDTSVGDVTNAPGTDDTIGNVQTGAVTDESGSTISGTPVAPSEDGNATNSGNTTEVDSENSGSSKTKIILIVVIVVVVLALAALSAVYFFVIKKKNKTTSD